MAKSQSTLQIVVIALINLYKRGLSPLLGDNCRFQPTCSTYAIEAINSYGVIKGGWLAGKRILKCHPLNAGGEDPVPKSKKEK